MLPPFLVGSLAGLLDDRYPCRSLDRPGRSIDVRPPPFLSVGCSNWVL